MLHENARTIARKQTLMCVCARTQANQLSSTGMSATQTNAMHMHDEEDDEMLLVGFSAGALYKRADSRQGGGRQVAPKS